MKVYTVNEAAEVLRVTPETVRRWARQGKLKGTNPGKGWRFTEKDIQRFFENPKPEAKA